jgi:hypothetical protein
MKRTQTRLSLFFGVMTVNADQRCSTSLLAQVRAEDLPLLVVDEDRILERSLLRLWQKKVVIGHTTSSGKEWLGKF